MEVAIHFLPTMSQETASPNAQLASGDTLATIPAYLGVPQGSTATKVQLKGLAMLL